MRILIACECSGVVREAFRAKGHDAWSCDILPAADGSPFHIQGDAMDAIYSREWDLLGAHPPCTLFNNASVWANKDPDFERYPGAGYHMKLKPGTLFGEARRRARSTAIGFVMGIWEALVAKIYIENPTGYLNTFPGLSKPQIIQPHQFGEDASKATCLWLKGLPPLVGTSDFPPRIVEHKGKTVKRWSNQTDGGQNKLPPSDDRASVRAVTYAGIAKAMASQWS